MKPLLAALALLVVLPAAALAAGEDAPLSVSELSAKDLTNLSLGVNVGFQDVHALVPFTGTGTPTFGGVSGGSVLTIGALYRNRLGADSPWYVDAGAGVGFGGAKIEWGGTIDVTQKEKFSSVYGNVGAGYLQTLTRKTAIYGGARLFYSSTKLTYEDDDDEFEGEPFKVFGFEPNMGCSHRLNDRISLTGEFYQQYGWGSGEVGDTKYNETVKYGCWRGSVMFHL
jgi:hypothetical protein